MALVGITVKTVKVVLPTDSAIVAGEYDDYKDSGYDESKLKFEGEPTRFVLGPIQYDAMLEIKEHLYKYAIEEGKVFPVVALGMAVKHGLKDWSNLLDEKGEVIICVVTGKGITTTVSDASMQALSGVAGAIESLGTAVLELQGLTEKQRKN